MTGLTLIGPTVLEHVLTLAEQHAHQRAQELIQFADGIAELYPELARRSRITAHDLLDLTNHLAAERTARLHIKQDRDRILNQRFPGAA